MVQQQEMSPKERLVETLSGFLHANRYILLIVLSAIVVFIIAYFIVVERGKRLQEDSAVLAEEVADAFADWISEEDDEAKTALEEDLVSDIRTILKNYPNQYGSQRALLIEAGMYFEKGEWQSAAESFQKLADLFSESYLAPLCLFNAGVCHEILQNYRTALRFYSDVSSEFPGSHLVPHALFSIGRLNEQLDDSAAAEAAYNQLEEDFPASLWVRFARNRLIALRMHEGSQE